MTSQCKIRKEKVRFATSDFILNAAIGLFSKKGYHGTRLEDIARAAGFSKAAMYNYFEDKEAIFLSLAIREHARYLEGISKLADSETRPYGV